MEEAWKDVVNIEEYCNGLVKIMDDIMRTKSLPKMTGLIKGEILRRKLMSEAEAEEGMNKFRAVFIDNLQLHLDYYENELRQKLLEISLVKECLSGGTSAQRHRQTMSKLMKGMIDVTDQVKQVKVRKVLTEVVRKFHGKEL